MNKLKSFAIAAVATLGIIGVSSACTPEEVAICKATPGCVEAFVQHSIEQDQLYAWAQGVQRAEAEAAEKGNNPFLTCVRHHESDRGPAPHKNGYDAQNPVSTASGAYQFVNQTWAVTSNRAGYGGYSTAAHAPAHVQDAVAYDTAITRGERYHWNGTGC